MDANQAIAYISLQRELDEAEEAEAERAALQEEQRFRMQQSGTATSLEAAALPSSRILHPPQPEGVRLPGGPKDRFNLVYLSLVISGLGFLLPYNVFINAVDFYKARYGSARIMFDLSTTYILVMLASVTANNFIMNRLNFQWRISAGYLLALVVLFGVTLLDVYLNLFSNTVSYRLTVIAAAFVSMGCTGRRTRQLQCFDVYSAPFVLPIVLCLQ